MLESADQTPSALRALSAKKAVPPLYDTFSVMLVVPPETSTNGRLPDSQLASVSGAPALLSRTTDA